MKKSTFKKGIALCSSVSMVALFLLYRAGAFDKSSDIGQTTLQTSHNGGNLNTLAVDSTKAAQKKDAAPLMLSSSKVLILTDKKPVLLDSLRTKPTPYRFKQNDPEMLGSSKSFIIFKPTQTIKTENAQLKLKHDTLKTQKEKGQ